MRATYAIPARTAEIRELERNRGGVLERVGKASFGRAWKKSFWEVWEASLKRAWEKIWRGVRREFGKKFREGFVLIFF